MSIVKEVKFNDDAKTPLIKGMSIVGEAVASTMGYRGRTVLIESPGGLPIATKDGVSVAKSIFLEDPIESLGAEFMKQACEKTVSEAGDGTTTTAVLAKAIVDASVEALKDTSAIDIKKGIELAKDDAIKYLKSKAIPVKDDFLFDVAKISANNDDELGRVISDAFVKAGNNGVVSYEESDTSRTYVDFIDGMPIERGYEFEGFNNVPEKQCVEFNDKPFVLLSNRKIQSMRDILPIIEYSHKEGKALLIASEMEYDVMKTLYANTKRIGLRVAWILPPSIAEKRRDYLTDIQLATNGMVLDIDTGDNVNAYSPEQILGSCDRLTVTKDNTVLFFNEKPNKETIASKIDELSKVIKASHNDLEKKYLSDRVAKLACGVSVVKVGANTEVELKEKIDRVDDAIHAVRAAISEGVIQGGGTALVNASKELANAKIDDESLLIGYDILIKAMTLPFYTILNNAGMRGNEIDQIKDVIHDGLGFDVKEYITTDMIEAGIIDPVKVVRCALENAVSVANTVSMTNTTVTHKRA